MLMMSVHGAKADVLGASSERAIDPQNTFEHRNGDLHVHSGCIDLVSQNSAVHHHRDHDDTVRSHAQIGAPLRERRRVGLPLFATWNRPPLTQSVTHTFF